MEIIRKFSSKTTLFTVLNLAISVTALVVAAIALDYRINIQQVKAFQVDLLPSDNLIFNPWFRSTNDNSKAGLDGWTDGNGPNADWTRSQKSSNPSPDLIVSGRCGNVPDYCGTAAKLSADDGRGEVGSDAYLYQVVDANPNNTHLKFFTHWVAHAVDPAEVTIYGGDSQNGPWTEVWVPFHQIVEYDPGELDLWQDMTAVTPEVETTISNGYPYYKVEMHVNLPSPEGFKFTGVYFTAVADQSSEPTPTPNPNLTPSPTPTPMPASIHSGNLEGLDYRVGSLWSGLVIITVHDQDELPVEGAFVEGTWSQGVVGNDSCTTLSDGTCTVLVEGLPRSESQVTYSISQITGTAAYNPLLNHDVDGDSDGTSYTVIRGSNTVH